MSNVDDGEVFVNPRERPFMTELEYENKMKERGLTLDGASLIPDQTPMQPPLGFKRQPTMVEYVRNMIRSENLRIAAESQGHETFEEADDFDVDEDIDPQSPYEFEETFDPPPPAPANEPAPSTPAVAPGATPAEPASPASSKAPSAPSGAS